MSVENAIDNLTEQFKDSEKITDLVAGLLSPIASTKQALNDLLLNRSINTAIGKQLDELGILLGLDRLGQDDEVYRALLKTKIYINKSEATKYYVTEAVEQLSNGEVISHNLYGGGIQILTSGIQYIFLPESTTFKGVLELSNGKLLELSNGKLLEIYHTDNPKIKIIDFFKDLVADGIGYVNFGFTNNRPFDEMFGFNDDTLLVKELMLTNGKVLELSNGKILGLEFQQGSVSPPFNFKGFSDRIYPRLLLSTGDQLELSNGKVLALENTTPVGGGMLSEGYTEVTF